MNYKNHTISIAFAQAVIKSAKKNGLDDLFILKNAKINHHLLKKEEARITPQQFNDLIYSYWQLADDEFMGMSKTPIRHGVFALCANQTVYKKNLASVYSYLCRFYSLVSPSVSLQFVEKEMAAEISIELLPNDNDPDHLLMELLLLIWHRFPSWLIGYQIPLESIEVSYSQPRHYDEYRLLFPCEVNFDQLKTKLIFSKKHLLAPVIQSESSLKAYLERVPLEWFKRQIYQNVYSQKVILYLQKFVNSDMPTMDAVADNFNVTTRTLRRKLAEESTSFQSIKETIKRDTAIHYLNNQELSIADIALKLGFSDTSAFNRAFKKWTGLSPGRYRQV